jgi:hypothetical protein
MITEPEPGAQGALLGRLDALERENRRLRRYGTMMVVAIAVILGVTAAMVLFSGRFGPGATAEVVAAKQFVLRGADGTVRGVWGTERDGTLRFALQDTKGRPRAKLTLLNDGSSGFTFVDSAGHSRVVFALLPDLSASLVFADGAGKTRSVLGISPGGDPTLVFADRDGATRAGLGVDQRGAGTFTLVDRGGRDLGQPDAEPEPEPIDSVSAEPAASARRR